MEHSLQAPLLLREQQGLGLLSWSGGPWTQAHARSEGREVGVLHDFEWRLIVELEFHVC